MSGRKAAEVGYGNPPARTRFAKGRSGNPKGRPKGSRNTKSLLREVLEQPVSVSTGAGASTVTMRQAILLAQAAKAAKGDVRAATLVLSLDLKFDDADAAQGAGEGLSVDDQAILEDFLMRHAKRTN